MLNVGLETLQSRLAIGRESKTAEEWIKRFHAWVDSHADRTIVLSGEAMSRDAIYPDR